VGRIFERALLGTGTLYGHINYFPIAQIFKLFLGISYVILMSYAHCEQALTCELKCAI
jgi:hypothetical protein